MMARIMYTFAFKHSILVHDSNALNSSNYYSGLNFIFAFLFYKTGILGLLSKLENIIKESFYSYYIRFYTASKIAAITSLFTGNSFGFNNPFVAGRLANFSNNFYTNLNPSKIIYLGSFTISSYVVVSDNGLFSSLFDKFLKNIS